jgi:predicted  nucleic acid-binding Zn-ribbon protein
VKDLEDKFVEVEKRVKALVSENADLKKRVSGLERELTAARRESRELENFHGKRLHIREKIERILHALEAAGEKK